LCVSFVAAQTPFQDDQQAYQYGYRQGYQHGMADMQEGLNFDYTHAHNFRSGISYDSYTNAQFRSGYADGYKDGYYGPADVDHDRDHDRDARAYEDDHHHDFDRDDHYYDSDNNGFAKVYTKDRFDGSHETFHVGQYAYLDGKWHKNIESVEVRGPVRVILFDKPNFRGKRMVIQNDVIDLDDYHFKDKAESMIVERLG
jgi:hypothetical protein